MKVLYSCFIALLAFAALASAPVQAASAQFQPGEWQIQSTVTPSVGHPVHNQTSVCAKSAGQTWQAKSRNQTCSPPTLTAISNGYNIKLACSGGAGPVQWKSISNINETFSNGGSHLQASGTTTTTVSYAGHAPMTSSAKILATGERTGACK
ncbi:MAG: DUF3617 domain-containing protein [Acidobacteriaceae bacterium]